MKKIFCFIFALTCFSLMAASADASSYRRSSSDVYVHGYTKGNGTYVQPHYRSAPDGNKYNNYGNN